MLIKLVCKEYIYENDLTPEEVQQIAKLTEEQSNGTLIKCEGNYQFEIEFVPNKLINTQCDTSERFEKAKQEGLKFFIQLKRNIEEYKKFKAFYRVMNR